MQLKEFEKQLKDYNEQINVLLREREEILIAWYQAFDTENASDVRCIYEKSCSGYAFILINGDFKLTVSEVWDMDFEGDLDSYYKQIEHGIWKHNALNRRKDDLTEQQRYLLYAKAAELRQRILGIKL